MTSAVYRNPQPSLSIPQTQNTAPVLEFACLYTHDIRRKQKRWQDGFLRFHTFNKRVMVYDVPRNFIGDTHWKQDEAVQDGDEVTLEKDGVMVQVAESVGRTETDLTELKASRRRKGVGESGSSSPVKGAQTPVVRKVGGETQRAGTQLKHRSLNALLGTPKGPIGKAALPTKSPFEERHADVENEPWEEGRPQKRQRIEQSRGWNVTRTAKTPAPAKNKELPLWTKTADAAKQKKKAAAPARQQSLGTKEVIELSDGEDQAQEQNTFLPGFSSDALPVPSSPAKERSATKQPPPQTAVRSSSPAFQTQKASKPKQTSSRQQKSSRTAEDAAPAPLPEPRAEARTKTAPRETSKEKQPGNSVHDDASSRRPDTRTARPAASGADASATSTGQNSTSAGQKLRIARTSSRKKTLLCQDQLNKKPSRTPSAEGSRSESGPLNKKPDRRPLVDGSTSESGPLPPAASQESEGEKSGAMRKQLQERLAKMRRKSAAVEDRPPEQPADVDMRTTEPTEQDQNRAESTSRGRRPSKTAGMDLAQLGAMIMPAEPSRPASPKPQPQPPMHPPPKQDRPLRKAISDPSPSKRAPGAPMRFTPSASPSRGATETAMPPLAPARDAAPARPTTAAGPKTRSKKPIQRSVSLNTTANGTSAVIFRKPFQTPGAPVMKAPQPEKAPDPWSREAFDLFSWRPPGWDEEGWCIGEGGQGGEKPS